MKRIYTQLLTDEEFRSLLEARNSIILQGLASQWKAVERQVERLGFGETYCVSHTKGPRGSNLRITPNSS